MCIIVRILTFYREEIMKEVINKINCANRTIIRNWIVCLPLEVLQILHVKEDIF